MKIIRYGKKCRSILKSSKEGRGYKVLRVLDLTSECKKETPGNVFLVYLKDQGGEMLVEIIEGYESVGSGACHLFYHIKHLKSQVNNSGSCFPGWAKGFGLTDQKLYKIIMANAPSL
jgi:hypothetical protein